MCFTVFVYPKNVIKVRVKLLPRVWHAKAATDKAGI